MFFKKNLILANLKYINSYNMMGKKLGSVYNFRTYFFPLGEVDVSFSNLLSTAINNFIKPKVDFFSK
jgi:hypothetical protein